MVDEVMLAPTVAMSARFIDDTLSEEQRPPNRAQLKCTRRKVIPKI
jgi:hypothetical protein